MSDDEILRLLDVPVDESTQIWYMARNWLFGLIPGVEVSLRPAAKLAAKSSHPDAVWITNILTKDGRRECPVNKNQFKVWLAPELEDSRAILYTYWLCNSVQRISNFSLFAKAKAMGNAYAIAKGSDLENYVSARIAAIQDEPEGWYSLGCLYSANRIDSAKQVVKTDLALSL